MDCNDWFSRNQITECPCNYFTVLMLRHDVLLWDINIIEVFDILPTTV